MATGRAYWKGYLKLSLVTCPVALYPASNVKQVVLFRFVPLRGNADSARVVGGSG